MPELSLFDFADGVISASASVVNDIAAVAAPYLAWNRLYGRLQERLANREAIDEPTLLADAKEAYGGNLDDRAFGIQDAYNAAEAAAVATIAAKRITTPDALRELTARLPLQRRRDDIKDELQQFSTPPTIAAFAAHLAAITDNDLVLEPSCGTGILAVFARLAHASVIGNERDPKRAHACETALGITVSQRDAGNLSYTYTGESPSVVLMNPPFSSDGTRNGTDVGFTHIGQGLNLLPAGGRLVAILASFQHPSMKRDAFKQLLGSSCSLRAAVQINGKEYTRMGTAYGVCIVVIDKTPDLPLLWNVTSESALDDLAASVPENLFQRQSTQQTMLTVLTGTIDTKETETKRRLNVGPTQIVEYVNADRIGHSVGDSFAYRPSIESDCFGEHPADIVESATLASVHAPAMNATVRMPVYAIEQKAISLTQFESVVAAAQAHESTFSLIDPAMIVRGGIMLGHGTGFGKGRANAAIIADNVAAGRMKHVYVTKNKSLTDDFVEAWEAITGNDDGLIRLDSYRANDIINAEEAILFATYPTLASAAREGVRSRFEQVVEWLGPEFDGVIVFDECHEAANAVGRGSQEASQRGKTVLALQRAVPNARIVYTSATAASKLEAFAYAERLGIYGANRPFQNIEGFIGQLTAGGIAAMEMLCRDLKSTGRYLAASLSLEGVTVEVLEHKLTPEQIEQYETVAQAWRVVFSDVIEALNNTSAPKRFALGQLESARQRSLQAIITTIKMATMLPHMEEKLALEEAVVCQVANTYEANLNRALAEHGEDLDNLDLSPRETLKEFVRSTFPTQQYDVYTNDEGTEVHTPLVDSDGNPILNREAVALQADLLARLDGLLIPDGPVEIFIDHFGFEAVAEATGRTKRVVRQLARDGSIERVLQPRGPSAMLADIDAFMDGQKSILLFSDKAGGVGKSYHASNTCRNQRHRNHYVGQVGWRAEDVIQSLGRTNRTNQASKPHWILVTTDVPGEKRFISTVARRLAQLGACTRGDRDGAGTGFLSNSDNLETIQATAAVLTLMKNIVGGTSDISLAKWKEQTCFNPMGSDGTIRDLPVPKFLNKILSCDIEVQRVLYTAFYTLIDAIIERDEALGLIDKGAEMLQGITFHELGRETLYRDPASGAKAELMTVEVTKATHKRSFAGTLGAVHRAKRNDHIAGFYLVDGEVAAIYTAVEGLSTTVKYVFPNRTYFLEQPNWTDLQHNINDEAAREKWESALADLSETYTEKQCVVIGTILPIYAVLPVNNPRVYRFTLDNGERYIGRSINREDVNDLREKCGLEAEVISAQHVWAHVNEGKLVTLLRGHTLSKKHLGKEIRIELHVPMSMKLNTGSYTSLGILHERVNYDHRYFVPDLATLERILERFSVQSLSDKRVA